ncbi:MAG: hypothetical protein Q4E36_01625 [Bacillota bacterium]|nr:hypothetical protein [Bacillota bacterium]
MKNKFLILVLGLSLILSGCKKDPGSEGNPQEKLPDDKAQVTIETPEDLPDPDQESPQEKEEGQENPEDQIEEENPEEDPEAEEVAQSLEEEIKALAENSDYISIIKMSQTGPNGKEIQVIEDLKGSLKNIVLPEIPNMQANYNYIIFLMDSETGDITLTDANRGLILIENDTDQRLLILKDLVTVDENKEEN